MKNNNQKNKKRNGNYGNDSQREVSAGRNGSDYGRLRGRDMGDEMNQQGRGTHRSSYGSRDEDYVRGHTPAE